MEVAEYPQIIIMIDLHGRSFLTLLDYTPEEIQYLLDLAKKLKEKKKQGIVGKSLVGKNVVLLFDKTSTRTRCAFEVGVFDEGGNVTFLTNSQMGKKESIEDTAKVLGRFYDGIEYRGFSQDLVLDLAKYSGVPVWNGLTDKYHPTQILADFLTLTEHVDKPYNKIKFVYVGDARNNMGNSLMIGCAKMGIQFVSLAPQELFPDQELVDQMRKLCLKTGGSVTLSSDINVAVENADAIYTDVWVSMGEEDKYAERISQLEKYRVTMDMIKATHNDKVIFMHCLPSFHDLNTGVGKDIYEKYGLKEMEVTDEVFRSRHSVVFDEAENRMHTIKAVMVATIGNRE